ncbi:SRPBCC domain-containing protein [Micromonospora sp. WMMD882]|uniref:SRPBCC family protein n=1 Tax=Micromonospora sp. WMMD882 TaxID=3015151 RepID=UPI00248C94F0|nr:SRPBCC domain-containing protein [Micromonospora sp. WMMD882]WBB77268.1 SRPBCC domain-containing protein [Micromonospora sp. WMMD882]
MTEPMTLRVCLPAPLKAVHHALTDPAELRAWLTEHAEVELPHRYGFWGPSTPEGDAPHQRLLHVDDHGLRFTWLLDGAETTTTITLDEEGPDATLLTLTQTHFDFADVISGAVRGVLQTWWALAVTNLAAHLEGRPTLPRVDFTSVDLSAELTIDAPAATVFTSLIDSEQASAWFGFPIGIEPRVGGRYAMGGLDAPDPAKILDLEQDRKLSVDWGPAGVSTWELAESAGRTRLTLVQSGFDERRPPYAAWGGIVSGLGELRRFHELPDWRPIWR